MRQTYPIIQGMLLLGKTTFLMDFLIMLLFGQALIDWEMAR